MDPSRTETVLFFFYSKTAQMFPFLLPQKVTHPPKSLQASATSCMVISSSYTSYVRKLSWTPASSLQGFGATDRFHGFTLTTGKDAMGGSSPELQPGLLSKLFHHHRFQAGVDESVLYRANTFTSKSRLSDCAREWRGDWIEYHICRVKICPAGFRQVSLTSFFV